MYLLITLMCVGVVVAACFGWWRLDPMWREVRVEREPMKSLRLDDAPKWVLDDIARQLRESQRP